jgi:hypothetical protein
MKRVDSQSIGVRILATVVVGLLLFGGTMWITTHADRTIIEDNDFFSFWLGARMTWTGQNAYDSATWVSESYINGTQWMLNKVYLYPLPLATLMSPLGLLSLRVAYGVWIFMSMVGVTSALLLLVSLWGLPTAPLYLIPLFLGILLNRGFFTTVRNGQLGGMFLFFLALAVFFWMRGNWLAGGMAIGILLLKPSFGFSIVGLCGIWLLAQRHWSALGGIALAGFLMTGIVGLNHPAWPVEFLDIAVQKTLSVLGYSPTLWGAAHLVCGDGPAACWETLGLDLSVVLGLATCMVLIVRRTQLRADIVVSLAICCALLVSPYLWAYDHILLILPLVVMAGRMAELKWPFLFTATWVLQMSFVSAILLMIAVARSTDEWSVILPGFCLVFLIVLFRKEFFGKWSVIRVGAGKSSI